MARSADDHARAWLGAFTAICFSCTIIRSFAKPLWFDELFTFYISRVPGWKERLALGEDVPPAFYALTRASMRLLGANPLAARLPEILGFWLMCVCLFYFVRRRCSAIYAFLGVLLAVGSRAYDYAYEARPYGILLGMAGLSLWSWQSAAEGRRRTLALVFLTVSVAIAVNVHYFGAQIAIPLLVGEACRTLERRRIDWGIVCAVTLGLSPLGVLLPLALRVLGTEKPGALWLPPHMSEFGSFYNTLFEPMLFPLVAGMAAAALVYFIGGREPRPLECPARKFPLYELAASIAYLFVPAMMLLACRLTTGNWYYRYALTAVAGCVILFPYLCTVLSQEHFAIPCLLIASLFCTWALKTVQLGVNQSTQPTSLCVNSRIYPKDDRLPIVVADRIWFLQMAHYSAPEIASRLVCLTGTANVARSPGLNQGTGTLIRWRDILPGTIEAYRTFLNRNREFWLLYHNQGGLEWLPLQFKADGYGVEYVAQDYDRILFRVRQ